MDIARTAKKRKVVFIMTRKEQETLFEKCRTYRRFLQKPLPEGLLSYLVGIAHKRSCGRNGQVLSFYAAVSSKALAALLPHLHWAAALPKEIGTPQKRRNRWPSFFGTPQGRFPHQLDRCRHCC